MWDELTRFIIIGSLRARSVLAKAIRAIIRTEIGVLGATECDGM